MKKLCIGIAILIGIAVLITAGWFGYSYWKWQNVPVFILQQKLSANGQFMESYLTSGDIHYVLKAEQDWGIPAGPIFTQWTSLK